MRAPTPTASVERRRRYAELSAAFVLLDDSALAKLAGRSGRGGWGTSTAATMDDGAGTKVFVKRIPLARLLHDAGGLPTAWSPRGGLQSRT